MGVAGRGLSARIGLRLHGTGMAKSVGERRRGSSCWEGTERHTKGWLVAAAQEGLVARPGLSRNRHGLSDREWMASARVVGPGVGGSDMACPPGLEGTGIGMSVRIGVGRRGQPRQNVVSRPGEPGYDKSAWVGSVGRAGHRVRNGWNVGRLDESGGRRGGPVSGYGSR